MTMVVDRSYAENHEAGFAVKPRLVSKKANVHMYLHHDGYPEWRGIELANWIKHMQEYRGFNNFAESRCLGDQDSIVDLLCLHFASSIFQIARARSIAEKLNFVTQMVSLSCR